MRYYCKDKMKVWTHRRSRSYRLRQNLCSRAKW
nr:MAG TPA: hypothetical protein [Caudoviricetes sp.]